MEKKRTMITRNLERKTATATINNKTTTTKRKQIDGIEVCSFDFVPTFFFIRNIHCKKLNHLILVTKIHSIYFHFNHCINTICIGAV